MSLPPIVILILCVVAGIGTVLALPGRRERAVRTIGGALLLLALLVFAAVLIHSLGTAAGSSGEAYFWLFSAVAIMSAVRVITHQKPVYSALYFILTVVASGGLFVLLWAEFMAAALVLIYAGAILITYVFVIMLASQAQSPQASAEHATGGAEYDRISREPVLASAAGFLLMGVLLFLIFDEGRAVAGMPQRAADVNAVPGTVKQVGAHLFTQQPISLELAGVLLTLAMVGAVIIARRRVNAISPPHVRVPGEASDSAREMGLPGTPPSDDPHSIPITGTRNPQAKAYPEA